MQGCVLFAQGDADAMKKATIYVDEDEPQQGTHLRHDVTMRSGKHAWNILLYPTSLYSIRSLQVYYDVML